MSLPYRARPGAGFVMLTAVMAAVALFFAWGWGRPPLDAVWQMQLELLLGERPALSRAERDLLQDVLARYPDLAEHMLEGGAVGLVSAHAGAAVDLGYAYLVRRSADAPGLLRVCSPDGAALDVEAATAAGDTSGRSDGAAPFVWSLPDSGPFPQLVEVRLRPGGDPAQARTMLVEVRARNDKG